MSQSIPDYFDMARAPTVRTRQMDIDAVKWLYFLASKDSVPPSVRMNCFVKIFTTKLTFTDEELGFSEIDLENLRQQLRRNAIGGKIENVISDIGDYRDPFLPSP